jgi:hypothetical protein
VEHIKFAGGKCPFKLYLQINRSILLLILFVIITVGVHGSANLQLGPYSSHLIEINSVLIQSIKVFT